MTCALSKRLTWPLRVLLAIGFAGLVACERGEAPRAPADAQNRPPPTDTGPPSPGAMASVDTLRAPAWLRERIREMAAEPAANPPVTVTAYRWRGDTVYYIPPTCCDLYGTLYDPVGTILCHPDGGITGEGDGRCPQFSGEADRLRVIWSDSRERGGR